jgi:predicted nucleic acid-binding protein
VLVLVPDAVLAEISSLGPNDPAAQAVQQATWIQVIPAPPIPPAVLAWGLDLGEASVIAVALAQAGSVVVLDDLAARQCAHALNIPIEGTLGLLLVVKQVGLVAAVRPVLEHLRQAGMYMTDPFLRHWVGFEAWRRST